MFRHAEELLRHYILIFRTLHNPNIYIRTFGLLEPEVYSADLSKKCKIPEPWHSQNSFLKHS